MTAGSLIYGGLSLIRAMTGFFTVESLEAFNVFNHGGVQASARPMDVYKGWMRALFTYLVPLAAINYYPMSYLLAKNYVSAWVSWVSPLTGVAFFGLGILCWKFGVRHYRFTGS